MVKGRLRLPIGLFVTIGILLILGTIAGSLIRRFVTPEQIAKNVLLGAIPFILIFVAIVFTFISVIVIVSRLLSNNIPVKVYKWVEYVIIAGIVIGIFCMFQPWWFPAYKVGFIVLLISTLSFILWSHVKPRVLQQRSETTRKSGGLPE